MASRVTRLWVDVHFYPNLSDGFLVQVCYKPVIVNESYREAWVDEYDGTVMITPEQVDQLLRRKLERLGECLAASAVKPRPLEIEGELFAASTVALDQYEVIEGKTLLVRYRVPPGEVVNTQRVELEMLTPDTQRLVSNIMPSVEQIAWNDLRDRLGATPASQSAKKKVLISYRKTSPERIAFAEAIAHRLGREGFEPWFDEWEVRPGNSLVREIGKGFENVYAVIPVLSTDYPGETWAREEFETAFSKRVSEGVKVIPVRFEKCEIPQLLRPLVYVDCTEHDPDVFEKQFAKIIDALNELELNPYR